MFAAIRQIIEPYQDRIGLCFIDMQSGQSIENLPDQEFQAASIIKMAVFWEFFKQVEAKRFSLVDRWTLKAAEKVGETPFDTGILRDLHDGIELTYEDIVTMMIVASDDTATNILIDLLGEEKINNTMQDIGLYHTKLQRKMMEYDKVRAGVDNLTSARDMARLLNMILAKQHFSCELHEKMIDILCRQRDTRDIPLMFDAKTKIGHKTGSIHEFALEHDVGFLLDDNGSPLLLLCVLTKKLPNATYLIAHIAKIAAKCLDHKNKF